MLRGPTFLLLAALTFGACDSCTLEEEGKRLGEPVANATRELSEKSGVSVHLKVGSGLNEDDKFISNVLVIYERKPELSPEELERLTNLVVRKHVPNVKDVTLKVPPR